MATTPSFPPRLLRRLDQSRILRLRAGTEPHRFIGIWVVVAGERVFVRSWEVTRNGWYHTLRRERTGRIQVGSRTLRVRARVIRGERLLRAVDQAYAAKYQTPGALKYVRGFRRGRRRATTTELLPW
jgi:hypothetical protein